MASTALSPYDTGLQEEAGFDIWRSSDQDNQQGRQKECVGAPTDSKLLRWSLLY